MWRTISVWLGASLSVLLVCSIAGAEPADSSEVESLRKQVQSLQKTVEQLQSTIQVIQKDAVVQKQSIHPQETTQQQSAVSSTPALSPLDQAVQDLGTTPRQPARTDEGLWSRRLGGTNLRLLDLSFDALFYAGTSSERDEALQTLQGGGHDPRKRGFTLGQAEIGLQGAVDPYFTGQAFLVTSIDPIEGETITELEEAFLTSTSLPYGLQVEVGHFFTEFGQINPRHPHQWEWVDQPVINSRFFGADGMRAPGFRSSWLLPIPWFSELHVGMQNANGGTMTSFLGGRHTHGHGEEAHAHEEAEEHGEEEHEEEEEHEHGIAFDPEGIGRRAFGEREVKNLKDFVYLTRWTNSWNLSEELTTLVGFSGLYGPNATGRNGDTWIYGMDMKWRWRPVNSFRGWPFLLWQTEVMRRDFTADRFIDDSDPDEVQTLPGRTLHDWGLYTQLLYGFRYGWAAGVRYEYAGGSGQSIDGRRNDPFRADRHRVSPLLLWQPSEYTRIRLQYNFDHADHLGGDEIANSVWFGFEWLYGAHPAHEY